MISELHTAALDYVRQGYRIFPLVPGAKAPLPGSKSFEAAVSTEAEVDAIWSKADYNIGFEPETAGLCVLDIDGDEGENTLALLEIENGSLVETRTVRTPRGGRHVYFRGSFPASASKLGPKVDTRGRRSYVLLPPSRLDGHSEPYRYDGSMAMASAPAWIAERLDTRASKLAASEDVQFDQPTDITRIRHHLATATPAVSGSGGNAQTFKVAAQIREMGASEGTAGELMLELYNPRCVPPWQDEELTAIVANAYAYAQNEPGASSAGDLSRFKEAAAQYADVPPPRERRVRHRFMTEAEQRALTPPPFLLDQIIPERGVTLIHAPPNSYKSFGSVGIGVAIAAGEPAFGEIPVLKSGAVAYFCGEGTAGLATLRREAAKIALGVTGDIPFFVSDSVPRTADAVDVEEAVAAIQAIGQPPRLIVIDTLARSLAGLNENDAKDMNLFLDMASDLSALFQCAVLVIAHAGKNEAGGARGSSALPAGVDAHWTQTADTSAYTFVMECIKMKDAEAPKPMAFAGWKVMTQYGESLAFKKAAAPSLYKGPRLTFMPGDIGRALRAMGATEASGMSVQTHALAQELAGPGETDPNVVANITKTLNKHASRYASYIKMEGVGRGNSRLWHCPTTEPAEPKPEAMGLGEDPCQ